MTDFKKIDWTVNLFRTKKLDGWYLNKQFLKYNPDFFTDRKIKPEDLKEIVDSHSYDLAQEIYDELKVEMEKRGCSETSLECRFAGAFPHYILKLHNVEFLVMYGLVLGTADWSVDVSFNGYIR